MTSGTHEAVSSITPIRSSGCRSSVPYTIIDAMATAGAVHRNVAAELLLPEQSEVRQQNGRVQSRFVQAVQPRLRLAVRGLQEVVVRGHRSLPAFQALPELPDLLRPTGVLDLGRIQLPSPPRQ